MQKGPKTITAIRHVESVYNLAKKDEVPGYSAFLELFEREYAELGSGKGFPSAELLKRARELAPFLKFTYSDMETPITERGRIQAIRVGKALSDHVPAPSRTLVSPLRRTQQTFDALQEGWPGLSAVDFKLDDRLREQSYGDQNGCLDWRLYAVFHPEQALRRKQSSSYEYRHANGESFLDVRQRVRSLLGDLLNSSPDQDVLLVSHHLTILAMRAELEGWGKEAFLDHNQTGKLPPNGSITSYERNLDGTYALHQENLLLA